MHGNSTEAAGVNGLKGCDMIQPKTLKDRGRALAFAGRMFQYGIAMTGHSTRLVLAEIRP